MQVISRFVITLFVLTCLGCGFQLRGYDNNPNIALLEDIKVICPNTTNWQLCQSLRQNLKLNGIDIREHSDVELRISPISQDSRVLSLQQNAAAAEYGLSSQVSYQIVRANDLTVLLERTINLQHSYRHESSELLAKERERNELQTELSHQLAQEIFRQLEVLNSKGLLAKQANGSPDEN